MFVTMGMSLLLKPSAFGHALPQPLEGHGSGGPLRLLRRQEPALDLGKEGAVRNRRSRGGPNLYEVHPGPQRLLSEGLSLPPDGKCPFECFETFLECYRGV